MTVSDWDKYLDDQLSSELGGIDGGYEPLGRGRLVVDPDRPWDAPTGAFYRSRADTYGSTCHAPVSRRFRSRMRARVGWPELMGSIGYGVSRKSAHGINIFASLCPFHEEKSPSFLQSFHGLFICLGCGAEGDMVDLVAKINHLYTSSEIRRSVLRQFPLMRQTVTSSSEARDHQRALVHDVQFARVMRALAATNDPEKKFELRRRYIEWRYPAQTAKPAP